MDLEHAQIGHRVREIRHWRGMNLTATAGLAGISASYLSLIERGQRAITKRVVLEAIATALRVSPGELTGQPYSPTDEASSEAHAGMAVLADLLDGWRIGEVPEGSGRPLAGLLADLDRVNHVLMPGADYAAQAELLPTLITDLLATTADPRDGRAALVPLLSAYHAAGNLAARLGFPGIPALATDRMRQVAEELDDPVWLAFAAWCRAHFLSGTNRRRQYELAVAAGDSAPAAHPETRGMANLTAALASAAQGRNDVAETHLAEAASIAGMIEPDVSPWPLGMMSFGRTNVGIWHVAIGVELGYGAKVDEIAVQPDGISTARQASYWVDYGRGLLTERKTRDDGLAALVRAEQLAPQQVRSNVFAREAVSELLATARREAGSRELRGLAWRMGVAPVG